MVVISLSLSLSVALLTHEIAIERYKFGDCSYSTGHFSKVFNHVCRFVECFALSYRIMRSDERILRGCPRVFWRWERDGFEIHHSYSVVRILQRQVTGSTYMSKYTICTSVDQQVHADAWYSMNSETWTQKGVGMAKALDVFDLKCFSGC